MSQNEALKDLSTKKPAKRHTWCIKIHQATSLCRSRHPLQRCSHFRRSHTSWGKSQPVEQKLGEPTTDTNSKLLCVVGGALGALGSSAGTLITQASALVVFNVDCAFRYLIVVEIQHKMIAIDNVLEIQLLSS